MKIRLALLLALMAIMLSSCGYFLVEDANVQVGSSVERAAEAENR